MKIIPRDSEDVIDCESVTNKDVSSVDDCKSGAISMGSNAFNFDYSYNKCWFKRCSDGDLELSPKNYGPDRTRFTDIYSC